MSHDMIQQCRTEANMIRFNEIGDRVSHYHPSGTLLPWFGLDRFPVIGRQGEGQRPRRRQGVLDRVFAD